MMTLSNGMITVSNQSGFVWHASFIHLGYLVAPKDDKWYIFDPDGETVDIAANSPDQAKAWIDNQHIRANVMMYLEDLVRDGLIDEPVFYRLSDRVHDDFFDRSSHYLVPDQVNPLPSGSPRSGEG